MSCTATQSAAMKFYLSTSPHFSPLFYPHLLYSPLLSHTLLYSSLSTPLLSRILFCYLLFSTSLVSSSLLNSTLLRSSLLYLNLALSAYIIASGHICSFPHKHFTSICMSPPRGVVVCCVTSLQ